MSENDVSQSKPTTNKALIGKGGTIAGSAISIIGNLLVLFGFVLPWASCSGYQMSGLDIVSQSLSGELGDSNGSILCLIPFLAIGMIGLAILAIPASLVKKIPSIVRPIGMILIALMTACACLPSCLFFTNIQSARNDPYSYGLGGYIRVEYGFWITIVGLFISFFGGILGIAASSADLLRFKKKKPDEVLQIEKDSEAPAEENPT